MQSQNTKVSIQLDKESKAFLNGQTKNNDQSVGWFVEQKSNSVGWFVEQSK